MTEYPDDKLSEEIKTYQKKNNLTVDGKNKFEKGLFCCGNSVYRIFRKVYLL